MRAVDGEEPGFYHLECYCHTCGTKEVMNFKRWTRGNIIYIFKRLNAQEKRIEELEKKLAAKDEKEAPLQR
jgi:hypothetical protein